MTRFISSNGGGVRPAARSTGLPGRRTVAGICGLLVTAGMLASGAPAAVSAPCSARQVAVRDQRPHRATVLCLPRPPAGHSRAEAAVALERLIDSGILLPARLRHLLPPFPAAAERAFARARARQLRHSAVGTARRADAGAAARARSGAGTSHPAGSGGGTTTQSGGSIPPGPGQTGEGSSSATSTSSSSVDGTGTTTRYTHSSTSRHQVTSPKCADFAGGVVTRLAFVDVVTKSAERHGIRTVVETEYSTTGSLTGGFTDAFALRGPLHLELDLVVQSRSHTEAAASHRVISRAATRTQRVSMTREVDFERFATIDDPVKAFTDMTIAGASGPKGTLTLDDFLANRGSLFALLVGTTGTAEIAIAEGFAATIENMNEFGCVEADASPPALSLARQQPGRFTVTVRGLDDKRALPSEQASRVLVGNVTIDPLTTGVLGPASGTVYTVTTAGGAGQVVVSARSRRGRAPSVTVPITEPPPPSYTGTLAGSQTVSDGSGTTITISYSGTVTLVLDHLGPVPRGDPPGDYAYYRTDGGPVHLVLDGSSASCTVHGETDASFAPQPDEFSSIQYGVADPTYALSVGFGGSPVIPYIASGPPEQCNSASYPYGGGLAGDALLTDTQHATTGTLAGTRDIPFLHLQWTFTPQG